VVIDKGRIIAEGSPLQLKQQAGYASLILTVTNANDLPAAQALLSTTGAEVFLDAGARQLTAAADGLADMVRIAGWLRDSDIRLQREEAGWRSRNRLTEEQNQELPGAQDAPGRVLPWNRMRPRDSGCVHFELSFASGCLVMSAGVDHGPLCVNLSQRRSYGSALTASRLCSQPA
jgi:hypothetical protein